MTVDAGCGLTFHGPWLVSTPTARRCRWLARWCQELLADGWNLAVWMLSDWRRWRYAAVIVWAVFIVWAGPHLPAWSGFELETGSGARP